MLVDNDLGAYFLSKNSKTFNIAGKLSLNEWRGQSNVEFIIDDISVNKIFQKYGPIVYRLGQLVFIQQRGVRFPLGPPKFYEKIAIIEQIHEDGLNLLKSNSEYKYEIITDISEENLIKKLPEFDAYFKSF